MVEFAAYLPIALLIILLVAEVFFSFTAMERIESAARAGARVAGQQGAGGANATARAALPDWLEDAEIRSGFSTNGRSAYTEVTYQAPVLWQNLPFDIELKRRVDMPVV